MLGHQHGDDSFLLIDRVEDSVAPPARSPAAVQLSTKRLANAPRITQQVSGDEFDNRRGDRLGQLLADGYRRWTRDAKLVPLLRKSSHSSGCRICQHVS